MSKEEFTQGEWSAVKGDTYCAIRSDNKVVADLRTVNGIYSKADAHLITAAPDMYREIEDDIKALMDLIKTLKEFSNDWLFYKSKLTQKQELLAKARGEQNG